MDAEVDVDHLLQSNGHNVKKNKDDSRRNRKAEENSRSASENSDDYGGRRGKGRGSKHRERKDEYYYRREVRELSSDERADVKNVEPRRNAVKSRYDEEDRRDGRSRDDNSKRVDEYVSDEDDYAKRKKESRRRRKQTSAEDEEDADDVGRKDRRSSHRHRKRRHRSSRSDDEDDDDVPTDKVEKRRSSRTAVAADADGDDMDLDEDDGAVIPVKSRDYDSLSSRRTRNYEDDEVVGVNETAKNVYELQKPSSSSRRSGREPGDEARASREVSASSRSRRDEDGRRGRDDDYVSAYARSISGRNTVDKDKKEDPAEERPRRRRDRDDGDDRSLLTTTSYDSRGRIIRDPAERTNSFASRRNEEAAAADAAGSVAGGTARRNLGRNIMELEHERRRYEHYGNERTPERWHKDQDDGASSRRRSPRGGESRRNDRDAKSSSKERMGRSEVEGKRGRSRSPRDDAKKKEPDSPVLNEEERDQRTVFVMQLSQRVTAWDLEEFFSAVGEIRDVRLIVDGRTKRSKGIAYIEFRDLESVPLAIGLNAQKLRGVPIKVQASHAERNRAAEAAAAMMIAATFGASGDGSSPFPPPPVNISESTAKAIAEAHGPPGLSNMELGGGRPYIPRHLRKQQALEAATKAALSAKSGTDKPMRVYVGSLHFSITEEDLRAIFEPFGPLSIVSLVREPQTGRSRGYAFLTYKREEDARAAMNQMNGFDLAGRQIKVSHVNEKGPDNADSGANSTERLEVEDGRGGMNMTGTNRLQLMVKLAEGTGLAIPDHLKATLDLQKQTQDQKMAAYQQIQQQKLQAQQDAKQAQLEALTRVHTQPNDVPEYATQCILLSNMFDPTQESGEEWHEEIRDDVISECLKHGGCVHAYVDRESKEGNVYAKCPSVAMAVATVKAMNGRHYGGRVLQANYVPVAHYNNLFQDSVRATIRLQPREAGGQEP